jgi:hypothetical protein
MAEQIALDSNDDNTNLVNTEANDDFNTQYGVIKNLDKSTKSSILDSIINAPVEDLIPWEECRLPSNGLYYGWEDGIVKVRAMGQTAEKILATPRLAQSGQSIEYLFRECCRFPDGFDPLDLLVGDRMFLLYFLRGITYGNLYEFAVTCTNCTLMSTHAYDLNELQRTITPANPALGKEPFKVNLPYLSMVVGTDVYVGIRMIRAVDANQMIARKKTMKNSNIAKSVKRSPFDRKQRQEEVDEAITDTFEKVIVHVMDDYDSDKIKAFINRLHAQDTAVIREWLKDNTPGIDSTIEINCSHCGQEFTIDLPITETFFRPAKSRNVRT